MNNRHHIHLIAAYLDGSITSGQRAELNELIERGEIDANEIKEMELLYGELGRLPDAEPGDHLRNRFYGMLKEKQNEQHTPASSVWQNRNESIQTWLTLPRMAAAAALLFMGVLIGNLATPFQDYRGELSALSAEVSQMREVMMLNLLDNQSATERLKAVNISSELQTADERIARALLQTLNNDSNVNVRLAAVEALVQHASAPMVREGLVASINRQESPLVQTALADAMLILQEEQSVDEFRQLLNRDEVDPAVREKLENTIAALI